MPERELAVLLGHSYAVRRVLFSPHAETLVASCRCGRAGGWVGVRQARGVQGASGW